MLDTLEQVFPGAVRAIYLHGSRSEGAALDDSDVDLTVVVNTATEMAGVGQALSTRRLKSGPRFDAHVDTVQMLTDPFYAFIAARLKHSGDLIRGEDIRSLVPEPDYLRYQAAVIAEACKGIAMLRDADHVDPPVDFPDGSAPFYGYTAVRKEGWYPPNTSEGTRELVAVATYCASAWVVVRNRVWITSKAQALSAIRQIENGVRADLVEGIYQSCRVKYGGKVPLDEAGRTELRALCERFLDFENEVLGLAMRRLPVADTGPAFSVDDVKATEL